MTPGRILVVEDNTLNLKLIRDVLQVRGYDVVEARSGEEGVDLAHVCCPDLVLMDLQLPGIDGVEAMHRMRRDPVVADVPVVAVTAFAMQEDRDRALRRRLRRVPVEADQRPGPARPGRRVPGERARACLRR